MWASLSKALRYDCGDLTTLQFISLPQLMGEEKNKPHILIEAYKFALGFDR